MKFTLCKYLGDIPHVPNLSLSQFSILVCLNKLGESTSAEVAEHLGYTRGDITKIIWNIQTKLAKREPLVCGRKQENKSNGPKLWRLTDFGKDLVKQYEDGIMG